MTFLQSNLSSFFKLFPLLIFFIIFNTCSEDEPTGPEENNNNSEIITNTIGPSGGELKDSSFSLLVPEGCFPEDVDISLSINKEYFVSDNQATSKTYAIGGVPKNFNNKIRVAIKHNGALEGSNFIAIATTEENSFLSDSLYAFSYLSAEDSSGFLVAEISSSMLNNFTLNKKNSLYNASSDRVQTMLKIIPSLKAYLYEKVEIYYPASLNTEAINFAERLNYILNLFITDFDFDFKFNNSLQDNNIILGEGYSEWKWPSRFFIIEKLNQTTTTLAAKIFEDNFINITIPREWLSESKAKQASFKFSFLLISILEKSFNGNQIISQENLFNALKLWLETYLYPLTYEDPPSYLADNELDLFKGFYDSNISIELATVIKYLVDFQEFDVSYFGSIFDEAHSNNVNHYYSLFSKVDNLLMSWFPDYYEKYITGEIFNLNPSVFIPSSVDWSISQESDTLYQTTRNYDDLSARRFVIELNHEYDNDSTSLILAAYKTTAANNDGVATLVFSADISNNLEHLVTARAEPIEIPNLKAYYLNGTRKVLVVVVNTINNGVDYTGQTEIEFIAKTKIEKEVKAPDYNSCGIGIYCGARHVYSTPESSYETTNNKVGFGTWTKYSGGFSGNTFTGSFIKSWDSSTNPLTISGSISAVFNEDYSEILSINWSETSQSQSIPNGISGSTNTTFSGKNIPLDKSEWGTVFQVKMEETCDHIDSFTDTQSSTNGLSYTMPEYWCNGDSKIYISFSKE
jgi:hypothetical protein